MGMVSSEYVTSMVLALAVDLAFSKMMIYVYEGLAWRSGLALFPMLKFTIVFLNTLAASRASVVLARARRCRRLVASGRMRHRQAAVATSRARAWSVLRRDERCIFSPVRRIGQTASRRGCARKVGWSTRWTRAECRATRTICCVTTFSRR